MIIVGAGALGCRIFDSARSGHAPNACGRGAVTGSFPPRCEEIDDTPMMLACARIILGSGALRGIGVDRPQPCIEL
ncbi:hypothetical protein [Nocardia xishanensis]